MPSFKRVHGDYTLDYPLDPEFEAHQHLPAIQTPEAGPETRIKKRCIRGISSEEGEKAQATMFQDGSDAPKAAVGSEEAPSPICSSQEDSYCSVSDAVGVPRLAASVEIHVTLSRLELLVPTDSGLMFWHVGLQKLVHARSSSLDHADRGYFPDLLESIGTLFILTASVPEYCEYFRPVPEDLFGQVLKCRTGGMSWTEHHKAYLIRDRVCRAIDSFKAGRIWPPSNASYELRQKLWELYFSRGPVEYVFQTHSCRKVVDFGAMLSSPAEHLPRKWIWHVFNILLELGWKFDKLQKSSRCLRSGTTRDSDAAGILDHSSQEAEGVARKCLSRNTWEDVFKHLESDVLETWDHARIKFTEIDCHRAFGQWFVFEESSRFENFVKDLGNRARKSPESFQPLVREHFLKTPPGYSRSYPPKSLAAERLDGTRVRTGRTPPPSAIHLEAEDDSDMEDESEKQKPVSVPHEPSAKKPCNPEADSRTPYTRAERSASRRTDRGSQNDGDGMEVESGLITNGGTDARPRESSASDFAVALPGAWNDKWEPEEKSFSDLSEAACSWWTSAWGSSN